MTAPRTPVADRVYLDHNATSPMRPEAVAAVRDTLDAATGNPSSLHAEGRGARAVVERAREQVAGLVGAEPSRIVFTSGGTESNNYAIRGVATAYRQRGNHVVTSAVEHPAVIEVCRWLETQAFWDGFFNPTYWPSLLLRTGIVILMAASPRARRMKS